MSRFNAPSTANAPDTKNYAGGDAHTQSPELELVSILLTSFATDQFYRSANDTFSRLKELVRVCQPKFVAQAAIYARTQFGMRSITHVVASELAKHIGGEAWAKDFYTAVVYRPDDMLEILSYHTATNGKVPNSMKKGLAKAFDKFDKYALAKYRGEGKGFKLVDVVNLVHPVPVEKNAEAIKLLTTGQLKSFDTWETELSKAGQVARSDDEKETYKKDVWVKLIREKKLGYFALLRNLRNILDQAPEVISEAIEQLTNEAAIKKSLVLPFRFVTAYNEILAMDSSKATRDVLVAIAEAVDISLNNVPKFDGETLVVLDTSSSMQGKPSEIGSLFAAVLAKVNNCDVMTFDEDARYVSYNPKDMTLTIRNEFDFPGSSTDFRTIFDRANKKYDRFVILSDMQGWVGGRTPKEQFNKYKKLHGANPFIYSFDLNSHGTLQFPEPQVFTLAGFSDKIFGIMRLLEQDRNALVNEIKKVVL